jgi:hypothetical protein
LYRPGEKIAGIARHRRHRASSGDELSINKVVLTLGAASVVFCFRQGFDFQIPAVSAITAIPAILSDGHLRRTLVDLVFCQPSIRVAMNQLLPHRSLTPAERSP